ncbi:DNA replication/repair protein RecF [Kallotenue papyrolyticum]|uniref:DNA replication/repair protein RecF n=1 Tax=Kallotenue papyrolyticum TaxID=1325125 RepID=UPI00049256F1|nr:DNA replication/repair protein RecF [Kallotenue papyrolyticum]
MQITHLSLRNFRNYRELELALAPGTTLFYGPNAAGKTSLLEAVFYLATTRSPRASADRELINWEASGDLGIAPFTRLVAQATRRAPAGQPEPLLIELVVQRRQDAAGTLLPTTQKTIRINRRPRRAIDLVGQLRVVLFTPLDIELLTGPPADRRHWLDVMLSQLDGRYVRALAEYQKAVLQRNALLRSWRDGPRPRPDEMRRQISYWDEQLATHGATILAARRAAIQELAALGAPIHRDIAGVPHTLRIDYAATVAAPPQADRAALQESIARQLQSGLRDDLDRGQTLVGPHRDDVICSLDGVDIGVYGSRGQQRSLTLALKLAEAELMRARTGDAPILLLDDILSELDAARRAHLLQFIDRPGQQTLMTATDLADFDPSFLTQINRARVEHGRVL